MEQNLLKKFGKFCKDGLFLERNKKRDEEEAEMKIICDLENFIASWMNVSTYKKLRGAKIC